MSKLSFLGVVILLFPQLVFAQTGNDHLVISQVQITGGPGLTANDFIEIFNPTESDVDLKGYRLVKRTKTGTSDTLIKSFSDSIVIPSQGYFLWANSDFTSISVTPDVTTSGTIAADNGIAIRFGANDTGTIVDSVAWGEATNAFVEGSVYPVSPEADMSLHRKTDKQDTDNNASDFEVIVSSPRNSQVGGVVPPLPPPPPPPSTEPPTTPKQAAPVNEFEATFLVINEILPNPTGADSGLEWVELYNSDARPIDISGWILDDEGEEVSSNAYTLPEGNDISGLGYLVVEIPAGKFALNNTGGDCVRLYAPDSSYKKQVCYEGTAVENSSYAKSISDYSWTDTPTPGRENLFSQKISKTSSGNVVINELLPNPDDDEEEEFVELLNLDSDEIDLSGWVIKDLSRSYEITPDDFEETIIEPDGFFLIPRTLSKIALNNTRGETVSLTDPQSEVKDEVTYTETAKENWSYSRTKEGKLFWTDTPTPNRANIFSDSLLVLADDPEGGTEQDDEGEVLSATTSVVSLAEVRELPEGTTIQTSGQVVALPDSLGKNVIYLSGSGIRVLLNLGIWPALNLGDIISIKGEVSSYHNEKQLKVAQAEDVIVTGQAEVKSPKRIDTGSVGEDYEGQLVLVSGVLASSQGETFFINDGSGEARIYIMDSTGIVKPQMRKGDVVVVRGIVSQFNDNYRVLPRVASDIEVGQVSAAQSLSRTGIGYWYKVFLLAVAGFFMIDVIAFFKRIFRKSG